MVKLQRNAEFGRLTVAGEALALVLLYFFLSPSLKVALLFALLVFYGLSQSVESYAFMMTTQTGLTKSKISIGTAVIQLCRNCAGILGTAVSTLILNSGTTFGQGIKSVFLLAMIVTATVVYFFCVPSTKKI